MAGPGPATRPGPPRPGAPGRRPQPHRERRARRPVHRRDRRRRRGRHDRRARGAGLSVVPPRSRLAEAVRYGIATARAVPALDTLVDRLHARYGGYHWVHAVPNAALLAAALTHADGDFTRSVCAAVSGGWDTDSNGAAAGPVAGLLAGHPDRLPARWTAPPRNRLATSVASFDGTGFDTLARPTLLEAVRP